MPAHNLLTTIAMSNGDNAGLALGLVSPSVMGPSRHITCVPNVLFKCIPATRLTGLAVQNRCNALGARVVPSQLKVLLLGAGGGGAASRGGKGASNAKGGGKGGGGGGSGKVAKTGRTAKKAGGKAPKQPKTSLRNKYMGRTPGKKSATGRKVQERMRREGSMRDNPLTGKPEFKATDNKWYPLREADMAHKTDAVRWWNSTGYRYGPKSPKVREWMLDPKNYRLDHYSLNRSAGARIGQRYRPPAP
jgi:hypothetical protein